MIVVPPQTRTLAPAAVVLLFFVVGLWLLLGATTPESTAADVGSAPTVRLVSALQDDDVVDPVLAASVLSVTQNETGWLLLVADVTSAQAVELCAELDDAEAVPDLVTMVVTRRHRLIQAC